MNTGGIKGIHLQSNLVQYMPLFSFGKTGVRQMYSEHESKEYAIKKVNNLFALFIRGKQKNTIINLPKGYYFFPRSSDF